MPNSDAFPERLKAAIGNKSLRTFGKICGLSDAAIRKYLSGVNEPRMAALVSMAKAADVNIEWLATGEGPMTRGEERPHEVAGGLLLDQDLLLMVVEAIEEGLNHAGREMAPAAKARLVLAAYDLYADIEKPVDKAKILKLIKSAA